MEMESSQNTPQSYALALLALVGSQLDAREEPFFGFAVHQVKRNTVYRQTAHEFLQALIEYSPSPETVAGQFLSELAGCENTAVETLVTDLNGDLTVNPDAWAEEVYIQLHEIGGNIEPVTELANYYLTNLVVAFRNPGRPTPQESLPPTPDPVRAEDISSLLDKATIRCDQAALKLLVLRRDGPSCLVTGFPFDGDGRVTPYCSHIIPFAFNDRAPVLTAIEMFTGNAVTADIVLEFINNPANAVNLQADAHQAMDERLAWGIEARLVNNEWKYYFRAVQSAIPKPINDFINDGDEIRFGMGESGAEIAFPDPRLCNLHLAIAWVFTASGFADVYEKYLTDDDRDTGTGNFTDELTRRLQSLLVLG